MPSLSAVSLSFPGVRLCSAIAMSCQAEMDSKLQKELGFMMPLLSAVSLSSRVTLCSLCIQSNSRDGL